MKLTSRIRSSISFHAELLTDEHDETLIFLRCVQIRPQAVTSQVADLAGAPIRLRLMAYLLEREGISELCRECGMSRKINFKLLNRDEDAGLGSGLRQRLVVEEASAQCRAGQ